MDNEPLSLPHICLRGVKGHESLEIRAAQVQVAGGLSENVIHVVEGEMSDSDG